MKLHEKMCTTGAFLVPAAPRIGCCCASCIVNSLAWHARALYLLFWDALWPNQGLTELESLVERIKRGERLSQGSLKGLRELQVTSDARTHVLSGPRPRYPNWQTSHLEQWRLAAQIWVGCQAHTSSSAFAPVKVGCHSLVDFSLCIDARIFKI